MYFLLAATLLSRSMEGRRMWRCEGSNFSSLVEYLNTIDGVEEKRNYVELMGEESEDVRLENISNFKEIIKKG